MVEGLIVEGTAIRKQHAAAASQRQAP